MQKKGLMRWLSAAALLGALSIGMTAYAEEADAASKKLVQEKMYYIAEDGTTALGRTGVYVYNDQGNLVQYAPFKSDGSLSWGAIDHVYDNQGNQIKRIEYREPGVLGTWDEYFYDDKGNCVKMISYENSASPLLEWREYGYDGQGNVTSENFYGADGALYCRNEYVYGDQGKSVKDLYYNYIDGVQTLVSWAEYLYDAQGNETNRIQYNVDAQYIATYGPISQWTGHSYGDQGNRLKTMTIYYGEYRYIWEYYYDGQGNETRIAAYEDGVLRSLEDREYDGEGNCVKSIFYAINGAGTPSLDFWTESVYQ